MSKSVPAGDPTDRIRMWVTDDKPCDVAGLPNGYRELMVEVKGDLQGHGVTFYGSNLLPAAGDDMGFLAHARVSPWIGHVPPVLFIQPVTEAVGVTIIVRGIQ